MLPGDGHTEWFRMDALPEILNFLETEQDRLGLYVVRPIRVPPTTPPCDLETNHNKKEARRLRLEQQHARYLAELASCAEHNAKVAERIQHTFEELYAAQVIVGIVSTVGDDRQTDAQVHLQGERRKWALDRLFPGELSTFHTPNGNHSVRTSSFYTSAFRFASVSISPEFTTSSLDEAFKQRWPHAETIRTYFHARTAAPGSPQDTALLRIHHRLTKIQSRAFDAFRRAES